MKSSESETSSLYKSVIKRLLDLLFSGFFLILFSPLYLLLSLIVFFKLGTPVFFRQLRPGKDEKLFCLVKYRSMTDRKDESGKLLADAERLTSFGKFMRSSSLDELPELWNIFKGDMSFVGPRPLSRMYLPFYTETEARRHEVRPGLTGLAQISGRNALEWDKRLALDIEYVDNISFKKDALIILRTIKKVFSREDVLVSGSPGGVGNLDEIRQVQRPGYLDTTEIKSELKK
ncbi:MAG: sugar transferase [Clostridiaceae bacterium]|jgi:lipopolysaccharide/colanic/teichoic acid biosynthesis glycosyltransferase|nr:sugar transferase [Clostridiaceae bacterium]